MKKVFPIAVCLLALWTAVAWADRRGQFMEQGPRVSSSGFTDPSGSNTLFAWWVASDLPLGTNSINNSNPWIDRVQGILLRGVTAPTNSPDGIYFLAGGLTNAPLSLPSSNHTVCVIFRPNNLSSGGSPLTCLYGPYEMGDATQSNPNTRGGFSIRKANGVLYWGNFFDSGTAISGALANSTTYDLIAYQSATTLTIDTNGVQSATVTTQNPPASGWPWYWAGQDTISAANPFDGWIKEILVWSNSFSATQIANVHRYATNTYAYSP